MRSAPLILFAGIAFSSSIGPPAIAQRHSQGDAAALFRSEVAEAPQKLNWKGSQFSDETRFAVAASGLSWRPEYEGVSLFRNEKSGLAYSDAASRARAFEGARSAGQEKIAFSFAFSLALDPERQDTAWRDARQFLGRYGRDYEQALAGILQSPDKLPLLPSYTYAAADLLAMRGNPKLRALFFTLAESSDRYLRSRGIAGLGASAFRGEPASRHVAEAADRPREFSVSAVERRMIDEALRRAAEDKNWHTRAAAAYALGLCGDESELPLLEKLATDRAYIIERTGDKRTSQVAYPVRSAASRALEALGKTTSGVTEGVFSGKELQRALRGGQNVTNDHSDVDRKLLKNVTFAWVGF